MADEQTVAVNGKAFELKQCTVVRYEDEFGHSYSINGEPVAGVTTLLSMGMPVDLGLLEYFKRNDKETQEEILLDAQERGTNVHQAIEQLLFGEKVLSANFKRPREKKAIAAFIDWFETFKPTDVQSEQVVAYLKGDIKFAGTMDLLCKIGDKQLLVDFKTSATPSRKNELQVEAYKAAIEQSADIKVDECYVLYLGTGNKGTRVTKDGNGYPTSGLGWRFLKSNSNFQEFGLAYRMALYMNNGKYPTPPQVEAYPESWQLLKERKSNGRVRQTVRAD